MKYFILFVLLFYSSLGYSRDEIDCNNAYTTMDINQCLYLELKNEETSLDEYFEKSIERYSSDKIVIDSIKKAQQDWVTYRKAHCNSVYLKWRSGTIRGAMSNSCSIKLTKQRKHTIWATYLTYMDSTPPVLVEPGLN